jgi:hypothetical protein
MSAATLCACYTVCAFLWPCARSFEPNGIFGTSHSSPASRGRRRLQQRVHERVQHSVQVRVLQKYACEQRNTDGERERARERER